MRPKDATGICCPRRSRITARLSDIESPESAGFGIGPNIPPPAAAAADASVNLTRIVCRAQSRGSAHAAWERLGAGGGKDYRRRRAHTRNGREQGRAKRRDKACQ